jgi:ketosteroid isomerase-like protein
MYTLQSRVDEFNRCISENRFAEALHNFYSEDLISVDNDGAPIRGRQPLLELVDQFMENTRNLSTKVINVMVSTNISVVERHYEFEYNKGGHFNYRQVSIQQWADGKIWHERHIYTL